MIVVNNCYQITPYFNSQRLCCNGITFKREPSCDEYVSSDKNIQKTENPIKTFTQKVLKGFEKYISFTKKSDTDISEAFKTEMASKYPAGVLNIQEASEDDLREIQKIDIEAFDSRYRVDHNFGEFKRGLVEDEITTYAIKDKNNSLLGYFQFEPVENKELYIYSMGIHPDIRRTRTSAIALKQMKDFIIYFVQRNNIEKVSLDVDGSKPDIVNLYKKFGFQVTKETIEENVTYGHTKYKYPEYHMEADVKKLKDK